MQRLRWYSVVVVAACLMGGVCADDEDDIIDLDDAYRNVPELIQRHDYPAEEHTVITSDGYILEMHRIPYGRDNNTDPGPGKPVVLVVHGLISSSADFVITGPSMALSYMLADEGFDVWLGNCRGNYYSRRHTTLNPDSSAEFWDFSFEECGTKDIQAKVDYILSVTGKSALSFVGHSQGTTAFFALCSLKPEYNSKFLSAQLLAPVAYLKDIDAPLLSALAAFANTLLAAGTLLGMNEVLARGTALEMVDGEPECKLNSAVNTVFCEAMLTLITDQDPDQFDEAMLPVLIGQMPAGASLKQFAHYGQVISDKNFCRWDYGTILENYLQYKQFSAPAYPLELITVPTYLRYSLADTLTPESDVMAAHARMSNSYMSPVREANFTHFLFAWGTRARELVYKDLITSMWQYVS